MTSQIIENKANKNLYILFSLFLITSGISITVSQGFLILCIIYLIFNIRKFSYSKTGIEKYIIIFYAVSLILALITPSQLKNLIYLKDIWLVSAFIIACLVHETKSDILRTIKIIAVILIFQAIVGLLQYYFVFSIPKAIKFGMDHYYTRGGRGFHRGGLLGMHLVFSCYIMMLSLPLIYIFNIKSGEKQKKTEVFGFRLAAIFSLITLIIIKTKSILMASPFGILPLFIYKTFYQRKHALWMSLLFVIFTTVLFVSFTETGNFVKNEIVNEVYSSNSGQDRIKIWRNAFRVWHKFPVAGAGGGRYTEEYEKVVSENPGDATLISHAHNDYLNQLAVKGVIGFLAFLFLYLGIMKFFIVHIKSIKDKFLLYLFLGLFASICVFMVASNFQCFFTDDENLVMLWFNTGLAAAIVKIESRKETGASDF